MSEAALPSPKGMVEVKYRRVSNGVEAHVTLPEGMTGGLIWKEHEVVLHQGEQTLTLP